MTAAGKIVAGREAGPLGRLLRGALAVLGSVALAVFLAETLLQVVRPELPYAIMPQLVIQEFFASSGEAEYGLLPGYRGTFVKSAGEFRGRVSINSRGWRDGEPDGRRKILFFGDSFVFGYGLNDGETIPDLLERGLGGEFDVVNLGYAAGRSPDSWAAWLGARPELQGLPVMLGCYDNDLQDTLQNEYLDGEGRVLGDFSAAVSRVRSRTIFVREGTILTRGAVNRRLPLSVMRLLKRSYVFCLLRGGWSMLRRGTAERAELDALQSAGHPDARGLGRVEASMERLRELAGPLAVVTFARRDEGPRRSAFYRWIEEWCGRREIPFLHVPDPGPAFFWKRDAHYNQDGARVAAAAVAPLLADLARRGFAP